MNPIETETHIRNLELVLGADFTGRHRRDDPHRVKAPRYEPEEEEPDMVLERRILGPNGEIKIEGPHGK